MLRIAICDDDKILVTQIEEMLNRYLDKKMIDRYIEIFYDGASLERIYEKGDRFDIIYLDIEMSGKNGIEAAKSIRRLDRDVLLIYVSSYETYFMQLFEVEPFRFIKKPIKETEFEEVIDFAYERIIEEDAYFEYKYNKMEKIADLLTKFMISESSSENLDYEVCKFGLLMAIEVAINTVIALCISFLLGMFRYGILFLTFFSLLRAFAGGVHLERFWSCTVLSGMVLSMVLLIAKYAVIPSIFSFALCVVMGILIFIVGPIDDKNRRISSDERCIFYRRLVYVLLFLVFTSALGVILDANRLAFIVSLTMGVFHIVQIIGKNKNMKLLEQ